MILITKGGLSRGGNNEMPENCLYDCRLRDTCIYVPRWADEETLLRIGTERSKSCPLVQVYEVPKETEQAHTVMLDRKTEPQTEMEKSGSRAVQTARCLNCHNAKACKENHWEGCKYEPWKLTAVDDEPQIDCRKCKHYATGKCKECSGYELFTDSGYVTDCSWR